MALTKEITEDYEIRGEFKTIQKRTRTAIMEDGVEISYKYHRTTFLCDMVPLVSYMLFYLT